MSSAVLFVVVTFVHWISTLCVATDPLVVKPIDATIMVGSDVTLSCTVRKNSSEPIRWIAGTVQAISMDSRIEEELLQSQSQYDRLSITGNHELGEYNLHFRNVQPEDAGQYKCGYFSVQERTAPFSPTARLIVILLPICEQFPQNVDLLPGNQFRMICTSQNNRPSTALTWFRNGQTIQGTSDSVPKKSLTVERFLTENDYDQPFTCVERMIPLTYAPHCSITPLSRTNKSVRIVNPTNTVAIGGASHLTCLTNQSFDSLSYRWFVGPNITSSNNKLFSFRPLSLGENNTIITCEVSRDGEFYGNDSIALIVSSSRHTEPSATPTTERTTMSTVNLNTYRETEKPAEIIKGTIPMKIEEDFATGKNLLQDSVVMNNPMEDYMIMFIAVAGTIGGLLLIAIVCLTLVLTRNKEGVSPLKKAKSCEQIDSLSELPRNEILDTANMNEANNINECIEAGSSRHYFTLEPDSRVAKKSLTSGEAQGVTYSKVSKDKKHSKKLFNTIAEMGSGVLNDSNKNNMAYAITTVGKPSSKRPMSAKRPLPERPDGEYRVPIRSYSESRKNQVQRGGNIDTRQWIVEASKLNEEENEGMTSARPSRVTSSSKGTNIIIDTDYTEVGESCRSEIPSSEEKAYEFTAVYDALEEEKEHVLKSNPDSGYHDSSSTEGTEPEMDDSDGQRSEVNSSSLDKCNLVKVETDDNLYASLE